MARKGLLDGLMKDAGEALKPPPKREPYTKGAIGAVSKSIAELKSRAIEEIDPQKIHGAGMTDRLGEDAADQAQLIDSIQTYGQQVPVLLRPHPKRTDHYEVVYGRRRVAALKQIGAPVKAMIRDLDDEQLVMAQGQENTTRRDLSFIEKANFVRQMVDAGYERKAICDALTIDKTVISRMTSVTDKIPLDVIRKIGAAHGTGRDRWVKLAEMLNGRNLTHGQMNPAIKKANAETSDQRFEAIFAAITPPREPKAARKLPSRTPLRTQHGEGIGSAYWKGGKLNMELDQKSADGFDDWLVKNFDKIHAQWKRGE